MLAIATGTASSGPPEDRHEQDGEDVQNAEAEDGNEVVEQLDRDGHCGDGERTGRYPDESVARRLRARLHRDRSVRLRAEVSRLRQRVPALGCAPMNVLGGELEPCSVDPMTGYFRDGYCHTAGADLGFHVVCAVMTEEFLEFSVSAGNDLVTPQPQWMFPGLRPGDRWCVVAARWQEALEAGVAPPVVLEATHASALEFVSLADLEAQAAR
jgi:uncharacterized protein